jgi:flagellin
MPVTIGTNPAASAAMRTLDHANRNLTSSLKRLSTGNRIANSYDDAASEAIQLRMVSDVTRYGVVQRGIQNAISFLEVQDGFLQTGNNIVSRVAELAAMAGDPSKNSTDKENYNQEFLVLQEQLGKLAQAEFNGAPIWGTSAQHTIPTSNLTTGDMVLFGSGATNITNVGVTTAAKYVSGIAQHITSLSNNGVTAINADLQALSNLRAQNGAYQSVLNYAYDNAAIAKTNLEAARGRIIDTDIAEESGRFARAQIRVQAAASMLAQANNVGANTLMQLLG